MTPTLESTQGHTELSATPTPWAASALATAAPRATHTLHPHLSAHLLPGLVQLPLTPLLPLPGVPQQLACMC